MLTLRRAKERGRAQHGWLDSWHTFSFGDYHDSKHMGFRSLRVINEDRVDAGAGFPTHSHRDMEILSYVLEGALAHRDSTGGEGIIRPGELQRMTAGHGVQHSEYNASKSEPVHFLQIWLLPDRTGHAPGYEQVALPRTAHDESRLDLVATSESGLTPTAVHVHANARVYRAVLARNGLLTAPIESGRSAWVQVARGAAKVNEVDLGAGDGLAIENESSLALTSSQGAELLIFDLG